MRSIALNVGRILHLHLAIKIGIHEQDVEREVIRVETVGSHRNRITDVDVRTIAHTPAEEIAGILKILDNLLLDDNAQVTRGEILHLHVLDELTVAVFIVHAFDSLAVGEDMSFIFKLQRLC